MNSLRKTFSHSLAISNPNFGPKTLNFIFIFELFKIALKYLWELAKNLGKNYFFPKHWLFWVPLWTMVKTKFLKIDKYWYWFIDIDWKSKASGNLCDNHNLLSICWKITFTTCSFLLYKNWDSKLQVDLCAIVLF